MERLIAGDSRWKSGKSSNDPRLRMSRPPSSLQPNSGQAPQAGKNDNYGSGSPIPGMGVSNEDLNSGFGRVKKNDTRPMPKSSQSKNKAKNDTFEDKDIDELDCLSSQHDESDDAAKILPLTSKPPKNPGLHTHDAIKKLSFRPTRSKDATGSQSSQPKVTSKKENQNSRSSSQDLPSTHKHDSSKQQTTNRTNTPLQKDSEKVVELTDDDAPPKAKERPKPRPLYSRQRSVNQDRLSPEVSIMATPSSKRANTRDFTTSGRPKTIKKPPYARGITSTHSDGLEEADPPQTRPIPAPFPMNTSPQRPTSKSTAKSDDREKSKSAEAPPPPRASTKGRGGKKGDRSTRSKKTIVSSEDEDDRDVFATKAVKRKPVKKPKAQPFPMSTQYIQGIGRPKSPSTSSRMSVDSDDDRPAASTPEPDDMPWEGDEDTITMSSVDHKTLCPYCDSPLPQVPSTVLQRLLDIAQKKSKPDPRPWNQFGRKAPFANFIAVCQRHKFETELLPEAEAKGWPKSIDWAALGDRVKAMEPDLQLLIDNPVVEDDWSTTAEPRPRDQCVFWEEIVAEVKAKGTKVVAGFQGQFANFEKVQLGYYGEIGSVIIHQTLYDLFPITTIDPNSVTPLTPIEFIQKILVPEVGARLIREDMNLEKNEFGLRDAVKILRESSSYGVIMFSADEREESEGKVRAGDTAVADRIIMARAEKRRKELEVEEAEETDEAASKPTRPKPRPLGKSKASSSPCTENDEGNSSDVCQRFDAENPPSSDRKRSRHTEDESEHFQRLELRDKTPDSAKRRKVEGIRDLTTKKNDSDDAMIVSPLSETSASPPRPVKGAVLTKDRRRGAGTSSNSRAGSVTKTDTEDSDSASESWVSRQRPTAPQKAKAPKKTKGSNADIDLCSSSGEESRADWDVRKGSKVPSVANMSEDEQDEVSALLARDSQATPRPPRNAEAGKRPQLGVGEPDARKTTVNRTASGSVPPLVAARERKQRAASESASKNKRDLSAKMKEEHKWLLSDNSQSSIEG